MVANGVGVGIVPTDLGRRYRRRHGYEMRPLVDAWARRRLCLCFRDWETMSAPMQSLLTHLKRKPNTSAPSKRGVAASPRSRSMWYASGPNGRLGRSTNVRFWRRKPRSPGTMAAS